MLKNECVQANSQWLKNWEGQFLEWQEFVNLTFSKRGNFAMESFENEISFQFVCFLTGNDVLIWIDLSFLEKPCFKQ